MYSKQELSEFFIESSNTYRFLAQALFKELNDEAIEILSKSEYPEDTGNRLLDKGYAMMRRYFAFPATDKRTQLACEYARIFLAAGVYTKGTHTAVPYESVFTSEESIVMQDSRDDVVERFRADGFVVDPGLHEPEDHLSFELEYLSHMCERAARLVESGDVSSLARNAARQVEFIDAHLLNWVPALAQKAQEYAKLTFYIGLLSVIVGTLEQDREVLEEVAEGVDFNAAS